MSDAEFAEWLGAERRRLRVSQEAVSRAAELSYDTIRNAESGQRIKDSTRQAIEKAIKALEVQMLGPDAPTAADLDELRWALERNAEDALALRERFDALSESFDELSRAVHLLDQEVARLRHGAPRGRKPDS